MLFRLYIHALQAIQCLERASHANTCPVFHAITALLNLTGLTAKQLKEGDLCLFQECVGSAWFILGGMWFILRGFMHSRA